MGFFGPASPASGLLCASRERRSSSTAGASTRAFSLAMAPERDCGGPGGGHQAAASSSRSAAATDKSPETRRGSRRSRDAAKRIVYWRRNVSAGCKTASTSIERYQKDRGGTTTGSTRKVAVPVGMRNRRAVGAVYSLVT